MMMGQVPPGGGHEERYQRYHILKVFNNLKTQVIEDILIAVTDSLQGMSVMQWDLNFTYN
jgi:hypothetical protein